MVHVTGRQYQILQGSPPQVCSVSSDAAECGGEGGRRSATACKQGLRSALDESLGRSYLFSLFNGGQRPDFIGRAAECSHLRIVCVFLHSFVKDSSSVRSGLCAGGEMDPWVLLKAHRSRQDLLSYSYVSSTLPTLSHFIVIRVL